MARMNPAKQRAERQKSFSESVKSIHEGGLHESLGVPAGQKIGAARIEAATHSKNAKTRKQAILAKTFAKMRRSK